MKGLSFLKHKKKAVSKSSKTVAQTLLSVKNVSDGLVAQTLLSVKNVSDGLETQTRVSVLLSFETTAF
jgi:hypothetical protein